MSTARRAVTLMTHQRAEQVAPTLRAAPDLSRAVDTGSCAA